MPAFNNNSKPTAPSPAAPRYQRPRPCPRCGQNGAVASIRQSEPERIVVCSNPECLHQWTEAGREEALRALRAELGVHTTYRYVVQRREEP